MNQPGAQANATGPNQARGGDGGRKIIETYLLPNDSAVLDNPLGDDTPYTWKKNLITVLNELEQTYNMSIEYRFRLDTQGGLSGRHVCHATFRGNGVAIDTEGADSNKKAAKCKAANKLMNEMVDTGLVQVFFAKDFDHALQVCCAMRSFTRRDETTARRANEYTRY